MTEFIDRTELGELATFTPNKFTPIHNWLYYKEGYARELVYWLIKELGLKEGQLVLDPFCGVGTTLLACKEKGLNAVGFDVSPVALLAARVKIRDYGLEELKAEARNLVNQKFVKPFVKVELPVVKKAFSPYALEDLYFFKRKINELRDESIREFFLLALVNASTKCSYAIKSGSMIRIDRKRKVPPARLIFRKIIQKMINDLIKAEKPRQGLNLQALKGDARQLDLQDESVDAVITSPPYLNKIEYANVYAIEQYLFFSEQLSRPAVRSFVGEMIDIEIEDVFNGRHDFRQLAARAYFKDMKKVLQEMFRVLKKGGKAAIVIGNGCFPEGVIQSDELLVELAEGIGFKAQPIQVLSNRWCMKERTQKVGLMRESLLVLEKP